MSDITTTPTEIEPVQAVEVTPEVVETVEPVPIVPEVIPEPTPEPAPKPVKAPKVTKTAEELQIEAAKHFTTKKVAK